jgi:hypothetical protein
MRSINHAQKKYHSISPGPGAYVPKHVETTKEYSLAAKLEHGSALKTSKFHSKSPGPGGYDPKPKF